MLQKYEERLIEIKKMLVDLGAEITMASEKTLSGMESLDIARLSQRKPFLRTLKIKLMRLTMKSLLHSLFLVQKQKTCVKWWPILKSPMNW